MKPTTTQRRLAFVLAELRDIERMSREAAVAAASIRNRTPDRAIREDHSRLVVSLELRAQNLRNAAAFVEREVGA
jgi:hypothetical protein